MTVYTVIQHEFHSSDDIIGVFSTHEKAKEYCDNRTDCELIDEDEYIQLGEYQFWGLTIDKHIII